MKNFDNNIVIIDVITIVAMKKLSVLSKKLICNTIDMLVYVSLYLPCCCLFLFFF